MATAKEIRATLKDGRAIVSRPDKAYLSTIAGWSGLDGSHMAHCWSIKYVENGSYVVASHVNNPGSSNTVRNPNRAHALGWMIDNDCVIEGGWELKDLLCVNGDGEFYLTIRHDDFHNHFLNCRVRKTKAGEWAVCKYGKRESDGRYGWLAATTLRGKTRAAAIMAAWEEHQNK